MKILNVLNNSALLVKNSRGEEFVLIGRGIGFSKNVGDSVDESKIEKTFSLENKEANDLLELLKYVPDEYFTDVSTIIRYANKKLNKELDKGLYITLTDHIHSAIERYNENKSLKFGLTAEMRYIYPEEFLVSQWIVDFLNATYDIQLPDDEVGFITVHIVAATLEDDDLRLVKKVAKLIDKITTIIKESSSREIDQETMTYTRFLTHLKFFAIRFFQKKQYIEKEESYFAFSQFDLNKTNHIIQSINHFFTEEYHVKLSENEKNYLRLHLLRIINE